ncbi:MAG: hypothetical protein FRX48_02245 [Lasallia pustulata]|uniref:Uncharacterized protein n=1 Tax=Lasallia pustulata TaxID=136370 RepID=A0A5M8PW25_9LECA|nr:MAG: hypothetical protein FRX48_02245 [Lasallia pustulata]
MPTAADIITYIGVPLAVLGVTPILFTCLKALFTLHTVRKALRHNAHDAVTRASLISGIVEVEIPRCSITPLDRDDADYWQLNKTPSALKGGTWTVFYWNKMVTGQRLYRLQYSDDLQEPQAEIDFEELMSFLLDRGAVPDIKGLHMLRVSGLWTPTGTVILLSPDTTQSVLRVAQPDDSDGILSLVLQWKEVWDRRDLTSLPPSWLRLENRKHVPAKIAAEAVEDAKETEKEKEKTGTADDKAEIPYEKPNHSQATSLRCHLAFFEGRCVIDAVRYESNYQSSNARTNVQHLRKSSIGYWFPNAVIALGQVKGMALWTCHLPESIRLLSAKETVPCGVMVLLGLLDEADTPTWATQYDPYEDVSRHHSKFVAQTHKIAAERLLSPAQAEAARAARQIEERFAFSDESQARLGRDRERGEKRKTEALNSSRLASGVVAQAAMNHLSENAGFEASTEVQRTAERILFEMVKEEPKALAICKFLDHWQRWNDRGGMNREDLALATESPINFSYAACLMGLFREASIREESSVALDLQECVRVWKKVRLG